jgi:hypothetical protein
MHELGPYQLIVSRGLQDEMARLPQQTCDLIRVTLERIADAKGFETDWKRNNRPSISTIFLRGGASIHYRVDDDARAVILVGLQP